MWMDPFDAAEEYLGLSMDELRELISDGQMLTEIAQESDKSVDGLIDALVAAQTASLDEAVDEGQITDEMRDRILDGLEDRVDELVREGVFGLRPPGGRFKDSEGLDVRTPSSGLLPRYVEELSAEPLVDEGDEIDRQARRVAILISAGAMGVLILIGLLRRQLTI